MYISLLLLMLYIHKLLIFGTKIKIIQVISEFKILWKLNFYVLRILVIFLVKSKWQTVNIELFLFWRFFFVKNWILEEIETNYWLFKSLFNYFNFDNFVRWILQFPIFYAFYNSCYFFWRVKPLYLTFFSTKWYFWFFLVKSELINNAKPLFPEFYLVFFNFHNFSREIAVNYTANRRVFTIFLAFWISVIFLVKSNHIKVK